MVKKKRLNYPSLWFQPVFNSSACNYCGGALCIIGKTHEAPQQVFRLLFYSLQPSQNRPAAGSMSRLL